MEQQPAPPVKPVSPVRGHGREHGVRQGIVLAAGRGSRLQPLSDYIPKPLQPVCNKPIMQYQLEAMREAGIAEIAIVIGPTSGAIRDYFGDGRALGVRLEYIEDPAPAGIAASLELAQSWVEGPFAVFLGDIFLALNGLEPALAPLAEGAAGSIVACRDTRERVMRNFAVMTDARGRVDRVIEKPADPPTDLKGCGVYVFDRAIFEAIRNTPVSPLRNEREITDAVQILVDMGRPVYATDIARWDMNITYPEDLLLCNLRMLREQQLDSLIADGAYVSDRVTVSASIIGARAVVDVPASLNQCLVLPGVHVGGIGGSVQRGIFAEGLVWMTGIPA